MGSNHPADPVVASIEKVLAAERDADRMLADCRRQADATIAAARERAAGIGRRTDARISRIHPAYLKKIEAGLVQLSQAVDAGADFASEDENMSLIANAVRRLAGKMTSDASG
jgi:hypothetical protein